MRRFPFGVAAAILVTVVLLAPAHASAQLKFLLEGGLSSPSGDFAKLAEAGYHGRVGLQADLPHLPLSLRAEGEADRFVSAQFIGHVTVVSGSASVVLSLGGAGVSPYVLAGIGQYRTSFDEPLTSSSIGTGYHFGVGLRLGSQWFVELRLVNFEGDRFTTRYIPISLAVRL